MDEATFDGLGPHGLDIDSLPVVRDLDDDHVALVARRLRRTVPSSLLPAARRSSEALDAMVEGVAHGMHEGIEEVLDDRLVQLGLLALDDEVDLLVEGLGEVAHEAREAAEDLADGHHADAHDAFLEITRYAAEVLRGRAELGHVVLEVAPRSPQRPGRGSHTSRESPS